MRVCVCVLVAYKLKLIKMEVKIYLAFRWLRWLIHAPRQTRQVAPHVLFCDLATFLVRRVLFPYWAKLLARVEVSRGGCFKWADSSLVACHEGFQQSH